MKRIAPFAHGCQHANDLQKGNQRRPAGTRYRITATCAFGSRLQCQLLTIKAEVFRRECCRLITPYSIRASFFHRFHKSNTVPSTKSSAVQPNAVNQQVKCSKSVSKRRHDSPATVSNPSDEPAAPMKIGVHTQPDKSCSARRSTTSPRREAGLTAESCRITTRG